MKKIHILVIALLIMVSVISIFSISTDKKVSAASLTETPGEIIVNPEGYGVNERLWQGIPSVEVTKNGRIWVSYFTGGEKEPAPENCVAYAYSDDNGKTWNDPFFVVVHPSEGARTGLHGVKLVEITAI